MNGRGSYVQIALAIDDATEVNGPLSFIPNTGDAGIMGVPLDESRFDETTAVAPLLKRGDVALFGPYTVHGSRANMSDKARRVFINGFAHPDANKRDFGDSPVGRFLEISR
jgi:ectoine hydroxylase-related dioxygenase (phytanoyl-CoA dioxygenase family)